MLDSIRMINPAALDQNIIVLVDQLQRIDDPRVRAGVLLYLFVLYFEAIDVDIREALLAADRGVKYAREHNTSEMRGLAMYFERECK